MAREQRKDVDYFPHDCSHGRKMHIIESKYGNDGYASWFKVLEQLGKANNHYLDVSDDSVMMFLASVCKIDEEKMNSILTDLAKLGAIDKHLYDNYQVVFSHKFIESIADAYRKRKTKMFEYGDVLALFEPKNGHSGAETPQSGADCRKLSVKKSREENSKVKKSRVENSTPNGVVDLKNQPIHPKIDFDKLVSFFNANRGLLPEVKKMSETRKTRINVLEKQYGKESIQIAILKVRDSEFLQGKNKDSWIASFDWIFKPANFLKILEDNYVNRESTRSDNSQRTDADLKKSANDAVDAMFSVSKPD